ncbi:unnamed protein product, partial [Rotaria socialis]
MFVDIWLGKEIDPSCLYSPKPSNTSQVTINDSIPPTANSSQSSRPPAQPIRGAQPTQTPSTLKS